MKQKLIVTHLNPDLDAVSSVWLLQRFDEQHFAEAKVSFVPAGERISKEQLEYLGYAEFEVVHVDTGKREFDHHTEELGQQKICAASMILDHLKQIHPEIVEDKALERMVTHFIEIDHFGQFYWPQPNHDRYLFQLEEILGGLKSVQKTDHDVVEFGKLALDAIYAEMKARVAAEEEVKKGREFESKWGRALGVETQNDEVIKFAQKEGYLVVVRKDPEFGNIRIKAAPDKKIDLTQIYEKILQRDQHATWYLHPSKAMLLNGSTKNANQVPSNLSLDDIIKLFEQATKESIPSS